MSVLEIILYVVIGTAVLLYIVKGIYTIVDRKKHPTKYEKKKQKEGEQLDE